MLASGQLRLQSMKEFVHYLALLLIAALVLAVAAPAVRDASAHLQNQASSFQAREQAYRANNIGVALLEQFKYREGAESFRRALQLEPKLALARINLAVALFNVPDIAGAQREAQAAAALAPDAPQPHYMMGLIAKSQNRTDDAIAAFQRVLKIDASDVGANVNLGQLYMQQRKFAEAIAAFRAALSVEPYNGTALYNLGTALLRANQRGEGQRVIAQFQELRQRGSGTTLGQNYLEQGRYAEAVASTGIEPELVDRSTPAATFTDATQTILSGASGGTREATRASFVFGRSFKGRESVDILRREIAEAVGGCVLLFYVDGDADLDLFTSKSSGQQLYRNDGGKLSEITNQSGALAAKPAGTATGAVAGDYDNDNRPDLFVIRDGGIALYHNDGGGKFSDVTSAAALPAYPYLPSSAAFLDADHDGDLDIFIAGLADLSKPPRGEAVFPDDFVGAACMLLRNDGNGKFTDT
ncbi:MAG TPA: tetratricopeptide repeat protein, partial [Pyrinomonadaceae bacterium]|nr:tetratricopeptide repeat protein [Pyrinomonadaceae bacterium]